MSKHFKPEEIRGYLTIDGRQVTYLKEGVRRKNYGDHLRDTNMDHINHLMISLERYEEVIKKLYGGDDFSEES